MPRQPGLNIEGALSHFMARGDEHKAMIALTIETHTTVPLHWVAERLHMGTRSTVSRTAALVKGKLERERKLSKVSKKIERALKS